MLSTISLATFPGLLRYVTQVINIYSDNTIDTQQNYTSFGAFLSRRLEKSQDIICPTSETAEGHMKVKE